MKLIAKEKAFENEKKELVTYFQNYLVAELNGTTFTIPIKATFKQDNKILLALANKGDKQ